MNLQSVLFFVFLLVNASGAPTFQLYYPEDDIKVLTIDNFRSSVENSTTAWLVKFYLSWCGGCQKLAPKWKRFAKETVPWKDMITVAAIDCADTQNTPICVHCGINKYPLIKYFHENYKNGDEISNIEVGSGDSIKKEVIKKIVEEVSEGRGRMYPPLLSYTDFTIDRLVEDVGNDTEYIILVVEPLESYLGVEVKLDWFKTPKVVVERVLENNTQLLEKLKIKKVPSVVVFDRQNKSQIFVQGGSDSNDIKTTIRQFLKTKGLKTMELLPDEINPNSPTKIEQSTFRQPTIKQMGDIVFLVDLQSALRYSLLQEISSVRIIKNQQLEALKSYLDVIKQHFPFGYNKTSFITKLTNLVTNSKEIEGATINQLTKEAEDSDVFPPQQTYLGCQGSSLQYRGYPCSLWQLFHYFSVNVHDTINPRKVLDIMYDYIKYFFGCQHCSQHFLEMSDVRNLSNVSSLQEAILWLWESHNVVNARLKGDDTEDPEFPKMQFPIKERCPECYGGDDSWKKEKVLVYLNKIYGKHNVRSNGPDIKFLG